MARARKYLKEKKKQKQTWLSRVAFHLPLSSFLSRTSVHQKTPRNVLKKYFFRLSSSEESIHSIYCAAIRERRRSWSCAKEVAEWSRCNFYGWRLRFEFHKRWNTKNSWSVRRGATDSGKTTTIAGQKGSVLTKETHSKWKHGRQDSWDKGVEGKEEIRVSRDGRRLVPTEEKRSPFKSGVV